MSGKRHTSLIVRLVKFQKLRLLRRHFSIEHNESETKQRFVYSFFELLKLHLLFLLVSCFYCLYYERNKRSSEVGGSIFVCVLRVAVIFEVPFNILNANHMLYETWRMCNITFHHSSWSDKWN